MWEDKLDLTIGNHKFGYLREHDPMYVVPGTMKPAKKQTMRKNKYTVKKGDVLGVIARKNGLTMD